MSFRPLRESGNRICAGCAHSIFLDTEGRVWASGSNDEGQVGVPSSSVKKSVNKNDKNQSKSKEEEKSDELECFRTPVQVKFPNNAVIEKMYCNKGNQNFFISTNGNLYVTGFIGKDKVTQPELVEKFVGKEINEIFCGFSQSFIVIRYPSFEVFAVRRDEIKYQSIPVNFLKDGQTLEKISPGNNHTLFLSNLNVYSVGSNQAGQLGLGNFSRKVQPEPITFFFLNDIHITDISAGHSHSLFLTDKQTVYSCGSNIHGQLGTGFKVENEKVQTPRLIPNLFNITKIDTGHSHSAFLSSDKSVYLCGANFFRECVDDAKNKIFVPTQVKTSNKFIDVVTGVAFTLFLTEEGSIFGTGLNEEGRLGVGKQRIEEQYKTRMKMSPLKIITSSEIMKKKVFHNLKFVDIKLKCEEVSKNK